LGSGIQGKDVFQLAAEVTKFLRQHRDEDIPAEMLTALDGIGTAKATQILAALEVGRRFFSRRKTSDHRFESLDTINWDFKGVQTQYLTHTFHSYPARFIPQIPGTFIQFFSGEGDLVLDPMCGCGTTLVEAALHHRRAIGNDLNPLACLISRVKTRRVDSKELDRVMDHFGRLAPFMRNSAPSERGQLPLFEETKRRKYNETTMKLPERKLSEIFTEEIMTQLQQIKEGINQLESEGELYEIALVCLSSTIRAIIEARNSSQIYQMFYNKLKTMVKHLKAFGDRVGHSDVKVTDRDARDLSFIDDRSVDLIVTSPPYVNALDYYRVHMYNMVWLGMDYKAFKRSEIGGHSHFISNRFRLLSEYIGDMTRSLIEMHRVLKRDRVCAIVVGNSSLEYELIESHKHFMDITQQIGGFTTEKVIFRNIDVDSKYLSKDIGKIVTEYIVVFQKTGDRRVEKDDHAKIADIVRQQMLKFRKQIVASPGSSTSGKSPSESRLRQNVQRIDAAIETIEKDIQWGKG